MLLSLLRSLPAATEPPLEPDQGTAQQWAEDELASPEYTSEPTWWDRFLAWLNDLLNTLLEWFAGLFRSAGVDAGGVEILRVVVIVIVVLIVMGVAVWLFLRRIRADGRARRSHSVFEDDTRTAAQIIVAAREAAGAGDYSLATMEAYRAVVRAAEEADLVDDRPGVTADEASASIGAAFLTLAGGTARSARDFDAVRYGEETGTAEQFAHGEATYEALLAALEPEAAR